MTFFDALFGRPKLQKPDMDRLFALPAAGVGLESELGLKPAGRAGVCLKSVSSGEFAAAETELRDLAAFAARDFQGEVDVKDDEFGYRWLIMSEAQAAAKLDELAGLVHLVGTSLEGKGFGEQLLAAVFRFTPGGERAVYLIYNYKRGAFYPFAPTGPEERDEALEFRLGSTLGNDLPVEKDRSRWFPLWNCPV